MESHKEPQHVSRDHENFVREFVHVYKENQILWDKNHPKYKSRIARNIAFDILINKCKEYYPDANIDFVKHKIDGMRGGFRREHRKVLESKKAAKTEQDIYTPSLWYYNLFLFTVGEECDENLQTNEDNYKNIYFWSKEHTVILIELLKKQPILYCLDSSSNSTKGKRIRAYNLITKELIIETGKHFEVGEVRKKITSLKQQFRRECRNRSNGRLHNTLWCYDLLIFLKEFWTKRDEQNKDEKDSDDSTDLVGEFIKEDDSHLESDSKDDKIFVEDQYDDVFDTIGKNVAIKLRDMTDEQRKYAEMLVNEVMYNGLMENLKADSSIRISRS